MIVFWLRNFGFRIITTKNSSSFYWLEHVRQSPKQTKQIFFLLHFVPWFCFVSICKSISLNCKLFLVVLKQYHSEWWGEGGAVLRGGGGSTKKMSTFWGEEKRESETLRLDNVRCFFLFRMSKRCCTLDIWKKMRVRLG